jgi:hypothetical protein
MSLAEELEMVQAERVKQYRSVLAEIASENPISAATPHDLPEAVREAIEVSMNLRERP